MLGNFAFTLILMFGVFLFCILTQNNIFPCELELQLEAGYRFKINLVSQRSTSLIAVRNNFLYFCLQFLRESWAYLGFASGSDDIWLYRFVSLQVI